MPFVPFVPFVPCVSFVLHLGEHEPIPLDDLAHALLQLARTYGTAALQQTVTAGLTWGCPDQAPDPLLAGEASR